MRVLLTGSAGFIGRHFYRELASQGHAVFPVDRNHGLIRVDVRDFFNYDFSGDFDLVIHCAAVVGGRILVESPMTHAENLETDAALFRWAERAKPRRIVYFSSVAAYPVVLQQVWGGSFSHKLCENDISLNNLRLPDELYGWAKLTGEMLASRSSVPVSVVRPFTVYGSGQDPIFPFANIARQFTEHRDPVTVWGTGNQVRDFIHVEDVVKAVITMAAGEISGPVNLCTGRGVSLRQLIGLFADQAGYSPYIETIDKPEGLLYRVGSPDKLHEFYTPAVSLEEGIRRALKGP